MARGSDNHLLAYAYFTVEFPWVPPVGETMTPAETNVGFQAWVYPDGWQEKHINRDWNGQPTSRECPTVINY